MTLLHQYGWTPIQQQQYLSLNTDLFPGRVISVNGFKYMLATSNGELETELSGRLMFDNDVEALPKVGDWVLFMDYQTMGYIIEVLPRFNALARKNPGGGTRKQILATNVDYAIIVQSLDRDFNLMRLDRYIVQIAACGITPVVLLNKADLVEDHQYFTSQVERLGRACSIFLCSTATNFGIDVILRDVLVAGKTFILIGSSGVGKSSLLNAFLQDNLQKTGSISEVNAKGKHTTTTRGLFILRNGAIVIDTPGMREFGVTFEEGGNGDTFPVVEALAQGCRFSDCKHLEEKGCAVLAALETGDLDPLIYESYIKLVKEQRRFQITAEEKKRAGKQSGKMVREAKNHRRKYKY
jgi:ribosome biogenesis GTPase